MFTSSGMEGEAKRLFAYLELNNKSVTNLGTFIVFLQDLVVDPIKDGLTRENLPVFGGVCLKFVGLVLELVEFFGDSLFYLLEIFLPFSLIGNSNK